MILELKVNTMNSFPGASPPPQSQPPFVPSPPVKKGAPIAAIALGIMGVMLALAVFGGIKAFHAVKDGSAAAAAVGDQFLDSMGQHRYPAARALFAAPVQATTPAGNLKDIETLAEKHHGAYVAHGQPSWYVQNWNGQTRVSLTYLVQFTGGTSPVTMTLVQTPKGYEVTDAHYQF